MRQLVKRLVSAKFFFAKFAIKLVPKNGPQEASLIFFGIILNYRIFDIWGKGRGRLKIRSITVNFPIATRLTKKTLSRKKYLLKKLEY